MNASKVLVSVIVPTRNRAALVVRAVRTALAQQEIHPGEVEVIVIAQESSDDTLDQLAALVDDRVRVLHMPPLTPGRARNLGIAAARGKWIAFLDDDDFWAPTKLARQLEDLNREHVDWGWTGQFYVNEVGVPIGRRSAPPCDDTLYESLCEQNVVSSTSTVMARRDALLEAGGFHEGVSFAEDWFLWIELGRRGRAVVTSEPLAAIRLGFGSASADIQRVIESLDYLDTVRGTPGSRALRRRRLAHRHTVLSATYLRADHRLRACAHHAYASMLSCRPADLAKSIAILVVGPRRALQLHGMSGLNQASLPDWVQAQRGGVNCSSPAFR